MDAIVEDRCSLTETMCNFTMYANVGKATTELLLDSREISRLTIHKNKTNQWALRKAVSWLPSFSLCDSCSALLFLFSGTIVILHDFTARYRMALWSDFFFPCPSFN